VSPFGLRVTGCEFRLILNLNQNAASSDHYLNTRLSIAQDSVCLFTTASQLTAVKAFRSERHWRAGRMSNKEFRMMKCGIALLFLFILLKK